MDTRKWSLDRIMQLPDWCYGRRWWIGTYVGTSTNVVTFFTIEDRLPDRFILWSLIYNGSKWTAATGVNLTLRLATAGLDDDSFWQATRLFHQIALEKNVYEIYFNAKTGLYLQNMRTVHEARGLRICGAAKHVDETATCENFCAVLISAVPKEIPDWLVAGLAGVRQVSP